MNIEKLNAEKGNRRLDEDGKPLQAEGLKESWQLAINQLAKASVPPCSA